jgi:hypothetical protein
MAGGDELVGASGYGGPMAAMLFIGAGTNVYDAYSAVMSSPWSTEKFSQGSDEEQMARRYVKHAMTISWGYAIGGSLIIAMDPGTPNMLVLFPIAGAALASLYMHWLYDQALKRAASGEGMGAQSPTATPEAQSSNGVPVGQPWSP